MLWTQTYDSGSNDWFNGMTLDAHGNVYFSGGLWNGANHDFLTVKYFRVGQGIAILPTALSDPAYNIDYQENLRALGGIEPFAWSIAGGALPAGLSLNATTGEISGTPTGAFGPYTFTVRVTDTANTIADQSYTITVLDVPYISLQTCHRQSCIHHIIRQSSPRAGGTPYSWSINSGICLRA